MTHSSSPPIRMTLGHARTLAKLIDRGQRILLVDLTDGEPTEFAEPGIRAQQAVEAARILGVDRCTLALRDRLL